MVRAEICGRCGYVHLPENTEDWAETRFQSSYAGDLEKLRNATEERPGREFHMACFSKDVLGIAGGSGSRCCKERFFCRLPLALYRSRAWRAAKAVCVILQKTGDFYAPRTLLRQESCCTLRAQLIETGSSRPVEGIRRRSPIGGGESRNVVLSDRLIGVAAHDFGRTHRGDGRDLAALEVGRSPGNLLDYGIGNELVEIMERGQARISEDIAAFAIPSPNAKPMVTMIR